MLKSGNIYLIIRSIFCKKKKKTIFLFKFQFAQSPFSPPIVARPHCRMSETRVISVWKAYSNNYYARHVLHESIDRSQFAFRSEFFFSFTFRILFLFVSWFLNRCTHSLTVIPMFPFCERKEKRTNLFAFIIGFTWQFFFSSVKWLVAFALFVAMYLMALLMVIEISHLVLLSTSNHQLSTQRSAWVSFSIGRFTLVERISSCQAFFLFLIQWDEVSHQQRL